MGIWEVIKVLGELQFKEALRPLLTLVKNEKYGDIDRFKFLINLLPFQYKKLEPIEKFIQKESNPPKIIVEFFV